MNAAEVIARKRDGLELSPEQIGAFISGFTCGEIPDYQMSALAMAIYLRGMTTRETAALTEQMLHSGSVFEWPASAAPVVDKHSTGGIGDKVSLILAPLLACCDMRVPMISGRGLGPTGGTLDKLESIPGYRTDLSMDEVRKVTQHVGCVITGATSEIAPADQKLYALRDVTATVASIPLITASIMSKKLAANLEALVLDVKFGSGAFMKSLDHARQLARSLVATGCRMGTKTVALITDMNQPLGRTVGNAVEVEESIETLRGEGPEDLTELVVKLASELLLVTGKATSTAQCRSILQDHLSSGRAMEKFQEMVCAQGGNLESPRPLADALMVAADRSGVVSKIDSELLGLVIIELGGGRRIVSDRIDHSVGLEMQVRLGDTARAGDPVVRVFAEPDQAQRVVPKLRAAISIGERAEPGPHVVQRITDAQQGDP